jgi:hypothetical protein
MRWYLWTPNPRHFSQRRLWRISSRQTEEVKKFLVVSMGLSLCTYTPKEKVGWGREWSLRPTEYADIVSLPVHRPASDHRMEFVSCSARSCVWAGSAAPVQFACCKARWRRASAWEIWTLIFSTWGPESGGLPRPHAISPGDKMKFLPSRFILNSRYTLHFISNVREKISTGICRIIYIP